MNVKQAVQQRRTVRQFKSDPVDQAVIKEIFNLAQRSPSNCNTQPWHTAVASGETRDKLEKAFMDLLLSGAQPNPHFTPGDQGLYGVYKERQFACAADYYGVAGVPREDKQARMALMARNWQFFDAPHAAFISMPGTMHATNALDVGIYMQTLMLLFVEYGLASCPQGALAIYPEPVLEVFDIPEGNRLIAGISFGYADESAQLNRLVMDRIEMSDAVTFLS